MRENSHSHISLITAEDISTKDIFIVAERNRSGQSKEKSFEQATLGPSYIIIPSLIQIISADRYFRQGGGR